MALSVRNLRLEYPGNLLFEGLSLELPNQVMCGIEASVLGGTTSLLKGLAGLIDGITGVIEVNGRDIHSLTGQDQARLVSISYEEAGLISFLTIYQNIVLPLEYHLGKDDAANDARVKMFCEMFELETALLLRFPHDLNDVQIRVVNLIRALIVNPALCLIDELDSGMHEEMIDAAFRGLREFTENNQTTMIIATSQDALLEQMDCSYKIESRKLVEFVDVRR
jgi:ABC-type transporter Mla maintaining outer membrane lipid asymmetry ATPase subunit MlaF